MDELLKQELRDRMEDIVEDFHELMIEDGYKDGSVKRGVFSKKGQKYVEDLEDRLIKLTIKLARIIIEREKIDKKFLGI